MANILTKQIMDHIVQKCAKDLADHSHSAQAPMSVSAGSHLTERHAAMLSELLNKKGQVTFSASDQDYKKSERRPVTGTSEQVKVSEPAKTKNINVVHGRAVSLDELLGRLK